jgi:hypothetical protein
VRRLHAFLREEFPFTARITIADNASVDGTWHQALALETELDGVRAVRLERPGRGGALRWVWSRSDAAIFAYMDVDLSTGLNALLPLLAPLLSGHSDVAIGTRLARGARVIRGRRRELATIVRFGLYRSWVFRGSARGGRRRADPSESVQGGPGSGPARAA